MLQDEISKLKTLEWQEVTDVSFVYGGYHDKDGNKLIKECRIEVAGKIIVLGYDGEYYWNIEEQ